MSEKLEKKTKRGKPYLDYLAPNSCAAQRPSRPAQPAGGPARLLLCRLRPRQREGSVPGARARHRATPPPSLPACLSPPRLNALERRPAPPRPLSHSPSPSSSPPALSLAHPSAIAAAARRCRGHRPPLASPTRFPAPPRTPLPPRQATHLRTRSIADAVVFFTTDAGDRPRRHHRQFAGRRTSPSTPACSASPP